MRKFLLFIVLFLLMHVVALSWKAVPMSQEELTMLNDNGWALALAINALVGITCVLIAKED